MLFGSLHVLDLAVAIVYFGLIVYLGYRKSRRLHGNQEDYFLAGRRLGKLYQLALNFGNTTDANSAVSVASLVYRHGVSGVWLGFQLVFLNPYYWFMNVWFRRARLMTMADLFHDRLGSRRLAAFYAIYQAALTVFIVIGFGNFITYKISSALLTKPAAVWTADERASVEEYHELRQLQTATRVGPLSPVAQARLDQLREREARGELRAYITALKPLPFYGLFALAVGIYLIMGGMAATAANDVLQGLLIVTFSLLLIPTGLAAIGGFAGLRERVPAAMFSLVGDDAGGQPITALSLFAIFLAALVQVNGVIGNMGISGSARNEFAARFGAVAGTFGKRFMFILWSFTGLIAVALFSGATALADPDEAWGAMSRRLLSPGLLGLMLTGVIAANMASIAAQAISVSALFVRNLFRPMRPDASEVASVRAGRWAIFAALTLGIGGALLMKSVFPVVVVLHTAAIPFGAAVLLMFLWRRLTVAGAWAGILVSIALNVVGPFALATIPAARVHPSLTVQTRDDTGTPQPVYFESVARARPGGPDCPWQGSGRLHLELLVLKAAGLDVEAMSPGGRFAARFFMDACTPFVFLLLVSLVTRPPSRVQLDQFFGRMKTPVGATPELEAAALTATQREPHRFDHLKLFPGSAWEFTRWDRIDTLGFLICCAVSIGIVSLFRILLRLAGP